MKDNSSAATLRLHNELEPTHVVDATGNFGTRTVICDVRGKNSPRAEAKNAKKRVIVAVARKLITSSG